ncbi:hypothetical protein QAD02_020752 [Eretmocerus hayati]|uniref:Uncharacterized protein n=1 Tax=Eretmocerus hayati TaxID=131215 RepID=A0ACC2PNS3_9HYME|nr:hypothetical protein QAD02_020752 [Eretmocerus hayati]
MPHPSEPWNISRDSKGLGSQGDESVKESDDDSTTSGPSESEISVQRRVSCLRVEHQNNGAISSSHGGNSSDEIHNQQSATGSEIHSADANESHLTISDSDNGNPIPEDQHSNGDGMCSDNHESVSDRVESEEERRVRQSDASEQELVCNNVVAQNNGNLVQQNPGEEHDEIPRLRLWAVGCRVPTSHLDILLGILRERVLPDLPASSKTFLQTTSANYLIEVMTDGDNLPGEFVYFGIEPGLQACVNPCLHEDLVLDLDFNIDGVKIKNSSSKQLWPCLCRVYYKKMPQVYKPFPVFAFYGNKKPKDMYAFFYKFINEMNLLSRTGVVIQGQLFRIRIRRIINDTPARDLVKRTSGHSSLNGCSRCGPVAVKIDHNVVYID